MLLRITNGSFAFGTNTILDRVNFEINKGEKIALIGRNGCGKTTLLKLISGEYELAKPENGETSYIEKSGDVSIGYLKQTAFDDESITLEEEIKGAYKQLQMIEDKMERLLEEMDQDPRKRAIKEFAELQERFELLGGYSYKKEYETAITKFGFSGEEKNKPLSEFSGGQRTKIAFIKLLLSKPDILLLDEPTNHLDINAIEWLEEYLMSYKNSAVIVSHDREFLDKLVTAVYEIEHLKTAKYSGNYTAYAIQKRLDWEKQQKEYIAQQREIARLNSLVERFRYKATKASFAKSKLKQIEHMEIIESPESADTQSFHGRLEPEYRSFKKVVTAKDLTIGYDKPLSTLSLEIERGQKVGIIGGNGLGKSTFLKTIAGKIPPLSGSYVVGNRVKMGCFDQQMAQYQSDKTVLDEFWEEFPELTHTEVRSALGAFLFSQEDVFKQVSALSGGEKVRFELCKLFQYRPNLLILDEPTNHMDIIGKETLEKMLKEYSGTLIFVSHDRYFVKQIATSLIIFEGSSVKFHRFGYEEYMVLKSGKTGTSDALANAGRDDEYDGGRENAVNKKKKGYSNPGKEKAKCEARLSKLEKLLEESETQISAVKAGINSEENASDYVKLTELHDELDKLDAHYNELLSEWESLTDLLKTYQ
ncbi:MAG: ABC-F family ATP-binding cassette domain-containing protein [Eubacteriales bacterium]|nr:ABC-F family ATP-binding cassette domain-containing protein [Eubacteriales bacterium]